MFRKWNLGRLKTHSPNKATFFFSMISTCALAACLRMSFTVLRFPLEEALNSEGCCCCMLSSHTHTRENKWKTTETASSPIPLSSFHVVHVTWGKSSCVQETKCTQIKMEHLCSIIFPHYEWKFINF